MPTRAFDSWYATVLFWKPQVALFVNEATLLPMLMPLAPSTNLLDRFPRSLAVLLEAHALPRPFVGAAVAAAAERCVTATTNRSVIGIMNEFAYLVDVHRSRDGNDDLVPLALRLAETPCGPLYKRHTGTDREVQALASELSN